MISICEAVGVELARAPGGPCAAARRRAARVSSSQNTAGVPVARARATASLTQSWIAASLVWHMRQMSPACDLVLEQRRRRRRSTTRTVPVGGDLEGLVVRAVLLGLLRHQADVRRACPSSPGRTRRARGSRRWSRRRAARRSDRGSRTSCPAARPSAFHIWPEARIAAGIDASMITSLGTCRFVIPRSESTIASAGPSAYAASIASRIADRARRPAAPRSRRAAPRARRWR